MRSLVYASIRLTFVVIGLITSTHGVAIMLPADGQIAFHSTRSMIQDIYLYDLRSAKLHNLTRTRSRDERTPAWSPDGESLLFVSRGEQNLSDELFYFPLSQGSIRQITPDGSNSYMPAWSPDGRFIAYVAAYNRLSVMPLDFPERGQTLIRGYHPHWSPDGSQITYTGTDITGSAFIGVIRPDGTDSRFLSVGGANFMDANWSPDHQKFVVVTSRNRSLDLYLLNPECMPQCQDNARRLTANAGNDHAPEWSPDGRSIVYTCAEPESPLTDICVLDVESGHTTRLTIDLQGAINDAAAWRPSPNRGLR